jgi:hypothetical protein
LIIDTRILVVRRNLEEMMTERGFEVGHSSVHRWVITLVPLFEKAFRRHKRPVGKSWRIDDQQRSEERGRDANSCHPVLFFEYVVIRIK